MVVVNCLFSWIILLVTIFSVVRMYRLRKQGKLPPPGKYAEEWVHMGEQDVTRP